METSGGLKATQTIDKKGKPYVKVATAVPVHPDAFFEFYTDSTVDVQIYNFKGIVS